MNINYLEKFKLIQNTLLCFINEEDKSELYFQYFIRLVIDQQIFDNKFEFKILLCLICAITDHHHRSASFFIKIDRILAYFKNEITTVFSNSEIYEIFQTNKRILLFLFQNDILSFNETFEILAESSDTKNYLYFFNEIKKNFCRLKSDKIKRELLEIDSNIFDNYEEKRLIGENDSFICSLIRDDSVEEFIRYINQTNLSISTEIEPSIFETNGFLIGKKCTLIEYATFYGSIQIFQYLRANGIELKPSLWLFAVHSNNGQLIHLLENYGVEPTDPSFVECLLESIKCHHNDISIYIKNNLLSNEISKNSVYKDIPFYNYSFFSEHYDDNIILYSKKEGKIIEEEVICVLLSLKKIGIQKDLFYRCSELTEIIIPSSVIYIDDCAFCGCSSLSHVTFSIPSSVTSIGNEAFSGCSSLRQITIPSTVSSFGHEIFTGIVSLNIGGDLEEIPAMLFQGCSSLKRVTIPSSVKSIGWNAFEDCSLLEQITIPSSVISIEGWAFNECSALKEVSFSYPSSIKSIGFSAFRGCSSLEKIIIPSSVISIGEWTFFGCSSLNQVSFCYPSSIKSIGFSAFRGCSSLEKITIPSSITLIEGWIFYDCSSMKDIDIPSSITLIKKYAFYGCSSMKQILIPSSVTEIGDNAFERCSSLTEIAIPTSVTSIGDNIFEGCSSLIQVTIPSFLSTNRIGMRPAVKLIKI